MKPPVPDARRRPNTACPSPLGRANPAARAGRRGDAHGRRRRRSRSAPACASRGRSSRSSIPLVLLVLIFGWRSTSTSPRSPRADRRREQAAAARRVPRVLPGLPAARPALGDPAPRDGVPHRGQGLDRDPVPVVAGQLPHPRQAGRRVPRVPAADQQRRVRLSRTFGTVFIERILDIFTIALHGHRRRVLELPRRPAARRSRSPCFGIGVVIVVLARAWRCSRCATSAGGSSSRCRFPQRVVEFYDRFEQGVFGALNRRQPRAARAAQRRDLDDRGHAPVLRGQGVRLPGRGAGHLGAGVRRPHRLAADGRAAEPGGARASWRPGIVGILTLVYGVACPRRPRSPCWTA